MAVVDLICLANSYKHDSRCVAGLRTDGSGWIRPVSGRQYGELEQSHYRLSDGSEPAVLDVIRIGLSRPVPLAHQPENWRIDESPWQLLERPASKKRAVVVAQAISRSCLLFGNPGQSVSEKRFRQRPARESLVLVAPAKIQWRSEFNNQTFRNRARVVLQLEDLFYDLPLTDPRYAPALKSLEAGEHDPSGIGIPGNRKILLAISLSEPFNGFCYKLVAAVVIVPPEWESFLI